MDGESFDRLSVVVHRLRDRASRRGALGLLLGGSVAAASGLLAHDAGAKNKNKNKKNSNCRGYGGKCWSNRDCCFSKCRSGRCWYGGGGGGKHCGGRTCSSGWGCCNFSGVSVCVPNDYPVCCGNQGFADGYTCCGDYGGACLGGFDSCTGQFGVCCQPGWKHCQNSVTSICIPNSWDCDQFFYQESQDGGFTTESTERIPTADPVTIAAEDWIELLPE